LKLPEIKPSLNGKHTLTNEAPPPPSGAFAMPAPTVFPAEPLQPSLPTLYYNFSRYWFGGVPLLRWLIGGLLLGVVSGALRWPLSGWWMSGGCVGLLALMLAGLHALRRHDFVTFVAAPLPNLTPKLLDTKQKVPVFATVLLTVQNKFRRYTWLPGFYRTFATHERALICQMQDQKFLHISRWPEPEIGLWYSFFMPDHVQQVRWGILHFGRNTRPAVAITYRPNIPQQKRQKAGQAETLYLAVQSEVDGRLILADLAYDVPAAAFIHPSVPPTSANPL
jgi:hypothetical protein